PLYSLLCLFISFFFNATATTEIYTLSLHDALPISRARNRDEIVVARALFATPLRTDPSTGDLRPGLCSAWHPSDGSRSWHFRCRDRKSTRLNSSHVAISYAVFCLKKKKSDRTNRHL